MRKAIGKTATGLTAIALAAGIGSAQTVQDQSVPETSLDLPANLQIFGKLDPNVRKPTAVVNEAVITGTDVDQRVALFVAAQGGDIKLTNEERDRIRLQVLRQLIDETLEIQEAKANDISVTSDEVNQFYARVAPNFKQTPDKLGAYLRSHGSSDRALRRQIEGEIAWNRYLRRKIEVNVSEAEVNATLARLKAQQGTDEFELREIYLKADPSNQQQVFANARQIIAGMEGGKNTFDYYARNFSDSTTKVNGGDLGWVKLSTLPDTLAAAVQQMQVGQIGGPIDSPGGFSIIYLSDKRQIGAADPRDARLSLKQITVRFPAGLTEAQAGQRVQAFGTQIKALQGCGTVEKVASGIGAEVIDNASVRIRDLPAPLQDLMLRLQVGQATPPFGSADQGVRTLVLCGRDEARAAELPRADQVQSQIEESRVNLRAQQKLRDLRRDAVVEYR